MTDDQLCNYLTSIFKQWTLNDRAALDQLSAKELRVYFRVHSSKRARNMLRVFDKYKSHAH